MFAQAFRDKSVWLSGHTGFKGAWLAHWLLQLGARVNGFALPPPTEPALFDQLALAKRVNHSIGDLRDAASVKSSLQAAQPDFVFHLAAQSLVRLSYQEPAQTYATNVMGTIHVLEALRGLEKPCAGVFVTTDKCYENREWLYGYREEDSLGGHDPYSSSKAAAEIAISGWRRSFFADHPVRFASARAGNVIGGGDWAQDRILPDCIRALQQHQPIRVRNKSATRPWQHVLDPLSGYLWLAALIGNPQLSKTHPDLLASAFNFGPTHASNRTVGELVTEVVKSWPGRWEANAEPGAVHEATLLHLATEKAHRFLRWSPVWDFSEAVRQTVQWYCRAGQNPDLAAVRELTSGQIESYCQAAKMAAAPWAAC